MKQYLIKKILLVFLLLFSITLTRSRSVAQASSQPQKPVNVQTQDSGPRGPEGQPFENVEHIVMPFIDEEKLIAEDASAPFNQPLRFAKSIEVEITPLNQGTWETLDGNVQLWRLRITSSDAISLSLGFTKYFMPTGGKLYVYTPDYSQILGPYTEQDNEEHGQLWTPIITGSEIVIEVSLPLDTISQLRLELEAVNHAYKDINKAEEQKSGSCNVDVVCSEGSPWSNEIRSVGRYTFYSGGQGYLCTGALINNTARDAKPYFLTASHCVNTNSEAASTVVYWNYQSATCRELNSNANKTPISIIDFPSQSGAYLRSTYSPTDMTLLELDDRVANGVNAYWSGWDRTGANATSAVGIHHPAGHEKRISFEYNATSLDDINFILLEAWDLGVTEGGSSGSPLYDQNHRIIGQLYGGYSACGNPPSKMNDYYGRLYRSWSGGGTNSSRLSNWLNPINSGVTTLNGDYAPTFADVGFAYWSWQYIESIYDAGITGGCVTNPLYYCPTGNVTRAQMAVFLLRGIHGSSYTPPTATDTVFNDVASNSFAAAWIEQLAAEGITGGCGNGNYCPNGLVTRAQMAVFLLKAKHGSSYIPPVATGTMFNDLPSNGFAAAWIEQLATEGITGGCGGGNFCPNTQVNRAQMAVFLQKAFNLELP